MADKQVPLAIVLKTVDNATAGLKAFNARLDRITAPVKALGKELGNLREHAKLLGLDAVGAGFRGVGSAVSGLLSKLLVVGGVATGAVLGLKALVDEFDDLGDKAERLGVSVDFLAQMRFAAERSGASVEQLDSGLQSFAQSLGQARAGTGRMAAFLEKVSPALLKQLKATKSNEEAFDLLAEGMSKISDPAKRVALAAKTTDAALAPLLARGPEGIAELRKAFLNLAGSQEEAAKAAGETDDAMKDLDAATKGVKAAIVTGLAPAMTVVVKKLSQWFVDHREDIKRWATVIGEKLPGAIQNVVTWIGKAFDKVTKFVDSMGGLQTVAIAVGAIIAGPLVSSLVTLGATLVKTTALASTLLKTMGGFALAGAVFSGGVVDRAEGVARTNPGIRDLINEKRAARGLPALSAEGMLSVGTARAMVTRAVEGLNAEHERLDRQLSTFGPARDLAPFNPPGSVFGQPDTRIKVEFANAPRGLRVTADPRSPASVDTTVGYNLLGLFE